MSRALALAAPAVAVLFVSAAAPAATTDQSPGLPAVTIPAVTTPIVTTPAVTTRAVTTGAATTPAVTTPAVATPAVTTPIITVPAVTVPPPPAPVSPPVRTLPTTPPVKTRRHSVTTTAKPQPAPVDSATGSSLSSGSSSGWSPTAIGAAPTAHRASRRSKTSLAVSRFHLARPAIVRVTVWQEAPQCRLFGRFTFAAGRGSNALRLPHRIANHALVVGGYRLVGLVHAREVIDERVRVERANGRLRVRKIHAADGCIQTSEEAIVAAAGLLPRPGADQRVGGGASAPASPSGRAPTSASAPTTHSGPSSNVLPQLSASVRHTLIFVLLALAIALLTVSSLPASTVRGGSSAAALARHRAALTSAGLAMIVAAALALLLT